MVIFRYAIMESNLPAEENKVFTPFCREVVTPYREVGSVSELYHHLTKEFVLTGGPGPKVFARIFNQPVLYPEACAFPPSPRFGSCPLCSTRRSLPVNRSFTCSCPASPCANCRSGFPTSTIFASRRMDD